MTLTLKFREFVIDELPEITVEAKYVEGSVLGCEPVDDILCIDIDVPSSLRPYAL